MKKLITLFFILLPLSFAFGQCYETFYKEGMSEYNKGIYDKALANFYVAEKCEDIPTKQNLDSLIKKAELCIAYKTKAKEYFENGQYRDAKPFYSEVLKINPNDNDCKEKEDYCMQEIECFDNNRNNFIENYNKNLYSEAIDDYEIAEKCNIQPKHSDIDTLYKISIKCDSLRTEADSLLKEKKYYQAKFVYQNVLDYNKNDQYCIDTIKFLEKKRYWQIGYNGSIVNFWRVRLGFVGKNGWYLNFRTDLYFENLYYSGIIGGYFSLFTKKTYSINLYFGGGYGYWSSGGDYINKYLAENEKLYGKLSAEEFLEKYDNYRSDRKNAGAEEFKGFDLELGLQLNWSRFYLNLGLTGTFEVKSPLKTNDSDFTFGGGYILNNSRIPFEDFKQQPKRNVAFTGHFSADLELNFGIGFTLAKLSNLVGVYIKADIRDNDLNIENTSFIYTNDSFNKKYFSYNKYSEENEDAYISNYYDYKEDKFVEHSNNLSYKGNPDCYSASIGITIRIVNTNIYKFYYSTGLGYANWGRQQQDEFILQNSKFYITDLSDLDDKLFILDNEGNVEEIDKTDIDGVWIKPEFDKSKYPQKVLSGVVWDNGFYFQIYQFTIQTSYSWLFGKPDEGWHKSDFGMFSLGLGWTF